MELLDGIIDAGTYSVRVMQGELTHHFKDQQAAIGTKHKEIALKRHPAGICLKVDIAS